MNNNRIKIAAIALITGLLSSGVNAFTLDIQNNSDGMVHVAIEKVAGEAPINLSIFPNIKTYKYDVCPAKITVTTAIGKRTATFVPSTISCDHIVVFATNVGIEARAVN